MTYDDPNEPNQPSPPAGRSPRQGVGGSPIGSTLSIVLAVVAVVVGFLILQNITDGGGGGDAGGVAVTESTVPTTVDGGSTTTTSSTLPPLVTQGATVVVANSSGVPGSAGRMSDELAGAGFTMATATNTSGGSLEQSIVYYDPANAAALDVANSVARLMGGLEVETVPSPPPVEGGDLGDASVVVMLGTAQSDRTLEELAPDTVVAPPPVAGGDTTGDTTVETTG
ncbi:MAG TPA: LytR C-terminal domain-containing protein [Ilumatobacteraceae bacterium]|nr:LytR C-terminal domain-containing protein [Ilumatobacteraceae bacterium]